jgi:hypothetical protein
MRRSQRNARTAPKRRGRAHCASLAHTPARPVFDCQAVNPVRSTPRPQCRQQRPERGGARSANALDNTAPAPVPKNKPGSRMNDGAGIIQDSVLAEQ